MIHSISVLAKQLFFSIIKTIYSINTVKQKDLINNVSQKVPIIQSSKRLSRRETEKSRVFVWVFVMRWLNLLLVAKYSRPDDSQTDTLKAKSKRYIYTKTWLLTPPPPPHRPPPPLPTLSAFHNTHSSTLTSPPWSLMKAFIMGIWPLLRASRRLMIPISTSLNSDTKDSGCKSLAPYCTN